MNVHQYIHYFRTTPHWEAMRRTVENSPWHREANTAVHTEMVMDEFITNHSHRYDRDEIKIALLALLFHDTGKPFAEEILEKKDGSGDVYRRYAGHEQDSAVIFMECYLTDPLLRNLITLKEARQVRFMIEHHLPFGYKDKTKRSNLKRAMMETIVDLPLWYDTVRSDAWGRISDDHDQKKADVEAWFTEFDALVPLPAPKIDEDAREMFLLIGPSGSGKTRWCAHNMPSTGRRISFDDMKLEFYGNTFGTTDLNEVDLYAAAWKFANDEEKAFKAFSDEKIRQRFEEVKRYRGTSIFVDTAYVAKKGRARFVADARAAKMKITAVEFWTPLGVLMDRQSSRGDKNVPYSSLKAQQYAQTCAWLGSEADAVVVVPYTT